MGGEDVSFEFATSVINWSYNHRSIQISEEFREISRHLYDRPNCIEDLTEQREFLKTIPDVVTSHQSRIDQAMSDYDMIEDYFYPLSDEDFDQR